MADSFVGEIRLVSFPYAPSGWAHCDGQLLKISENTALFSILGTTYGGDGKTTFALPDLRGRTPVHTGASAGSGAPVALGEAGGEATHALTVAEMPAHTHGFTFGAGARNVAPGAGALLADGDIYGGAADTTLAPDTLANAGAGAAHQNLQPSLAVNFVISLYGIFPQRP